MSIGKPDIISDRYTPGKPKSIKRSNLILRGLKDLLAKQGRYLPGRMLAIMILGIALAEVIAMIVVYYLRDLPYILQVLVDATIMTIIIFPVLYFLSFKPLLRHIHQQSQSEKIIQTRLSLIQFAKTHTLDELLQFTLDQVETLTGSTVGFFHFLESDQKTIRLHTWSTNTRQNMCRAEGKDSHYDVAQAGVWADAIRLRQPVLHNNYAALPDRKGLPEGHANILRELVVPVLRSNQVMAIVGLGNKAQDYSEDDVKLVSTLADFAWDVIIQKQAEDALRQSEEKFRTLVDWTYDWEIWVDPEGSIVYTSPACQRITGYLPDELISDPELLIQFVHSDERQLYVQHHQLVHDSSAGPSSIEYRIIDREGSEHWIEHICRPLFDTDGHYLGRRVSNRDVTERKQAEKKIFVQNEKEKFLTRTIQTIQADIARDLHDSLGQNIGFLRMNLDHLSESQWGDLSSIKNQILNMTHVANESYELVRTMLAVLQSENSADPLSLFSRYADQVAERSQFQVDLKSRGQPAQLSPNQIRQLFYIFREALSNIEKHAKAEHVSIDFNWGEHLLTLVISDNGCGFDPQAVQSNGHYGVKFMRERVELMRGSFSVQSIPGQGTTLQVVVPYEQEPINPSIS